MLRQRDQKFSFIRGLVADVLRVDVEHAHVIEAALDGRDQWLLTRRARRRRWPAARRWTSWKGGSISLDAAEECGRFDGAPVYDWNQHPQRIRLAIDLVRFEPADAPVARHLLGRTIVVDALDDALSLHRERAGGLSICDAGGRGAGSGRHASCRPADGGDGVAFAAIGA